MNDLNKTPLTCEVTSAVALWMDSMGFKPVETEVEIPSTGKGWIADLAGIIIPTQTELLNLKMVRSQPRWGIRSAGTGEWMNNPDRARWDEEVREKIRLMTCLVEVKTTRADFLGDRKWKAEIPADMAFLAIQKGLIRQEEWPEGWGILEFRESGIRRLRSPVPKKASVENQLAITLAIAIRRDHHTRYARHREFMREDRQRRNEDKAVTNMNKIARAVMHIVRGEKENVVNALSYHGIYKPSEWLVKELETMWGIGKDSCLKL